MNVSTLKAAQPAAAPAARKSLLSEVKAGKIAAPLRILVYGPEGIGKSTFAASAPKPIWLGADNGTQHLDIERYPSPTSWTELRDAIADLTESPHKYATLVVDPLGWFEPMVWAETCRRCGESDIDDIGGGFQKGFEAALIEWRILIADIERMSDRRGMNVILIAHSQMKKQKSPDAEDFERYTLQVQEKAAALFRQWCDYVLFAKRNVWTEATDKKKTRFRGIADGARYLHTAWSPAYDAKSRPQLPDPLPFREADAWATFSRAREFVTNRLAEKQAELEALLAKAAADIVEQVRAFIAEDPKDVTRYDEAIGQLKATQQEK